jgi:hypothetical protein
VERERERDVEKKMYIMKKRIGEPTWHVSKKNYGIWIDVLHDM